MPALILVLLLIFVLAGAGFAVEALWYVAVALLVIWILGFFIHIPGAPGAPRRRWYRW
jgi:hypothetical protein